VKLQPSLVPACAVALAALLASARSVWQARAPWPLKPPAALSDGRPEKLARASELSCAPCHAAQVEEWAATTHALAWENEPYQEELVGRKKAESCHGCHAPVALHGALDALLAGKPQARADARHFGVSCESCHLATDGALLGPTGAATDEHATRKGTSFDAQGSNALCASCHRTTVGPVIGLARDFEQSAGAAAGATCVGCHMAPRAEVPVEGVGVEGRTRTVRSHSLQTPRDPAFLALGFELTLAHEPAGPTLRVRNLAGHRVPGLIGREIEFVATASDAALEELGRETLTLTTESYLRVDETLELALPARTARVRVLGRHHDPRMDKPVTFLERELGP